MELSKELVDRLVQAPREALNVEIKRWIDPATPEGIGKIVVACIALRNRNGGYLIIGFDDKSLEPVTDGRPADLQASFHIDILQQIISKYASIPFELAVGFGGRDGQEFPVIGIDSGVTVPVAATRDLLGTDGKPIIREHAVYFRTLRSNGTPSSSMARHSDWRDIIEICFENREADIGRFLRRHLGLAGKAEFMSFVEGAVPPPLRERAFRILELNEERMKEIFTAAGNGYLHADRGSWSVLLLFDPQLQDELTSSQFLDRLSVANPSYTGWPVWLDSRSFRDKDTHPKLINKAWETTIVHPENGWGGSHADFYRSKPNGELYLWRVLQDDLSDKVTAGEVFDPMLMIYRVLEVLAVGLAFAKAFRLGEETTLAFAFKWKNLEGREIDAWANQMRYFSPHGRAMGNEAEGYVEIKADTPLEALALPAKFACRELFDLWNGWDFPLGPIEEQLQRMLNRER